MLFIQTKPSSPQPIYIPIHIHRKSLGMSERKKIQIKLNGLNEEKRETLSSLSLLFLVFILYFFKPKWKKISNLLFQFPFSWSWVYNGQIERKVNLSISYTNLSAVKKTMFCQILNSHLTMRIWIDFIH